MAARYRWRDPQGHDTITKIVEKLIPQWPNGLYPAQLDLVARVLEGQDLLCSMPTGGGKSALFSVPVIVLCEMARNPGLYPNLPTRPFPQGMVVTPTKGLATNIVLELSKLNIPALSYCHETITEARMSGRDLVRQIGECKTWNVVCVDPEHLRDKAWREISAYTVYRANIVYSCTDEAHLINEWGIFFRPHFKHIGMVIRGRLPSSISVFALSATLQPGIATQSVLSTLGMLGGHFYEHRSSNERPNTQFIMEPLEHGVGGKIFPQLLLYLNSRRKAVIHCRTIDDVLRVFLYLWKSLPPGPHRLRRIKMYHSLRTPAENEQTLRALEEDAECQVVIATIAFANGLNVKCLLDSISVGFPDTVDQMWQEKGRVGRDPDTIARGVVLFQPSALAAAEKQIAGLSNGDLVSAALNSKGKRTGKGFELAKAKILTEKTCYVSALNKIYGNRPLETSTLDCITAKRRVPCSLCATRKKVTLQITSPPLPSDLELPLFVDPSLAAPLPQPNKNLKLKKKEREAAETALLDFGRTVYYAEHKLPANRNRPKSSFFPTSLVRAIFDAFMTLDALSKLEPLLGAWVFAKYHGQLYAVVHSLRTTFCSQRELARVKRNAKQRAAARKKKKKASTRWDSDDDGEMESSGVQSSDSDSGERGSDHESWNEDGVGAGAGVVVEDQNTSSDSDSSSDGRVEDRRSSPIPPPPKRARRALAEVTNKKQPARTREALKGAAEVSALYRPEYRTSRRLGTR